MKTRSILIGLFVICFALGATYSWSFFATVNDNLSYINDRLWQPSTIFLILMAVLLQLAGHLIRSYKHKLLLEQIRPIHFNDVFKGQMIGFLFNILLPLRLGEIIRAHYIGKGVTISRSAVFATIVFERLIDLGVAVIFGLCIIALHADAHDISYPYASIAGSCVGAFIIFAIVRLSRRQNRHFLRAIYVSTAIFNTHLRDRMRLIAWSFMYCLKNVIKPHLLAPYMLYSAAMWVSYLVSAILLAVAFLPQDTINRITAGLSTYIAVGTPLGPAYASNFHNAYADIVQPLSGSGLDLLASGFMLWLLLSLPTIILGLVFLLRKQRVKYEASASITETMKNKLYRDSDISKEFGHYLDAYFQGAALNLILNNHESANTFTVIKTFKGGSNALTLLAWQDEVMVVKKITLPKFADKLEAQYRWLAERKDLKRIAKAVGEQHHQDHYSIDIEFREEFAPFFDYIHATKPEDSWRVLKSVVTFMTNNVYQVVPLDDQAAKVQAYINDKVIGKVADAAKTSLPISQLLDKPTIVVNGRELTNFNQILKKIQKNKQAMSDLQHFGQSPIHGDLTVDNVIVNRANSDYLLLDPNNENTISDPVTDYGKLFQSLHSGYEFMVTVTKVQTDGNRIAFEEKTSSQYSYLYDKLNAHLASNLSPEQYRSILFHEAVHYCRMLTYRVNINYDTAVAFYGVAIRLFNDFLEQYED